MGRGSSVGGAAVRLPYPSFGVSCPPHVTEKSGAICRLGVMLLPGRTMRCSSSAKMQPMLHMSMAEE